MTPDELVRATTAPARAPLVPELDLLLATDAIEAWTEAERLAGRRLGAAYWALAWPGGQALARHVLDHPALVAGRTVLDFAAGCGLAGVAAARAGARDVLAADVDPLALAACRLNAARAGVTLRTTEEDLVGRDLPEVEVVLAGDVCYERSVSARIVAWLRSLAARGATVLLADPGRAFTPRDGLEELARHVVPTPRTLERASQATTVVWRVTPASR